MGKNKYFWGRERGLILATKTWNEGPDYIYLQYIEKFYNSLTLKKSNIFYYLTSETN